MSTVRAGRSVRDVEGVDLDGNGEIDQQELEQVFGERSARDLMDIMEGEIRCLERDMPET